MTWEQYLAESNRAMRRNNLDHGIVYTPPERKHGGTADAVREYLTGYGWRGVTTREVAEATGRGYRSVGPILDQMVADGEATCVETITRGPRASRRKTYFGLAPALCSAHDDAGEHVGVSDNYFEEEV